MISLAVCFHINFEKWYYLKIKHQKKENFWFDHLHILCEIEFWKLFFFLSFSFEFFFLLFSEIFSFFQHFFQIKWKFFLLYLITLREMANLCFRFPFTLCFNYSDVFHQSYYLIEILSYPFVFVKYYILLLVCLLISLNVLPGQGSLYIWIEKSSIFCKYYCARTIFSHSIFVKSWIFSSFFSHI